MGGEIKKVFSIRSNKKSGMNSSLLVKLNVYLRRRFGCYRIAILSEYLSIPGEGRTVQLVQRLQSASLTSNIKL